MADWTRKLPAAARRYLEGRRLDEVECIVADLSGIARGKAMPASKFGKQTQFYLPNSIFLQTITGDWAEDSATDYTEPDMVLTPDYSTASAAPWTADITLQVIHDIHDQQGNPVPMAPRNVLKRVVGLYNDLGLEPVIAPEMEFYLVARNIDPNQPIEPPMGRSGRRAAARQAYSMSAVDEYGPVIDDIYDFAEAQGFEIDGILQEGGAGQIEMNLRHGDPVLLADEIFYFKRLIREAALRHDCFATFMAKPIQDEPGSAMHIHHSVVESRDRPQHLLERGWHRNRTLPAFHRRGCRRTCPRRSRCWRPMSIPIAATSATSRRRSTWNGAATTAPPACACRSRTRRRGGSRTGCRGWTSTPISASPPRWPAGCWACARRSCRARNSRATPIPVGEEIPRSLYDALDLFRQSEPLQSVLGEDFARVYIAVKENENKEFLQVISPWEREHLLLNV